MDDLRTIYNMRNKVIENSQIGNYFPPKAYLDPVDIKYQRQKMSKSYMKDQGKKKLDLKCKKGTFLELIQKREKTMPSPSTYKPIQYEPSYKKRKFSNLPSRSTNVDDIVKENKKNPTPSPSQYLTIKSKSTSLVSFAKAENTNYLDATVFKASISPGVGQYNLRSKQISDKLGKFDKSMRSASNKQNTFPCPFTYKPQPTEQLFSQTKKSRPDKPIFNKEKRFEVKPTHPNKTLFYAGISEWGMKSTYKKKDMLSTLSNHNIYSKSVYYH